VCTRGPTNKERKDETFYRITVYLYTHMYSFLPPHQSSEPDFPVLLIVTRRKTGKPRKGGLVSENGRSLFSFVKEFETVKGLNQSHI
jgi:hypothetical protein